MFRSKRMYDICFRAVKGLPLPARELTTLLIESVIARLLTLDTVIVCNFVWMSNHVHMQLVSLDMKSFTHFHGQLKKRLTDVLKRLLNIPQLNIWKDRTNLGEVLDLDAAIRKVFYEFTNPQRALIVRTIEEYKGCNTWKEFCTAPPDINACVEKEVPWVQLPDIEPLSRPNPSYSEEKRVIDELQQRTKTRTTILKIYPFKWLEPFGVTDPDEIEKIRQKIIQQVREEEARLSTKKFVPATRDGFDVTNSHIPSKKERKVFVFASTKEARIDFISSYKRFVEKCRMCYEFMKQGVTSIDWPIECYVPPKPRLANPI